MLFEKKYNDMLDASGEYSIMIENLKNQVYGYNVCLTVIAPYGNVAKIFEDKSEYLRRIDMFAFEITDYFKDFNNQVRNVDVKQFTDKEKAYIKALIFAIFGFLLSECNKTDYTFLGMIKILKTFLVERDEEDVNNKSLCTFYRMYKGIKPEKAEAFPVALKNAYDLLFTDFDSNYIYAIANGLWTCIRFYLYDKKLDYTSDKLMMLATTEMLEEISERLNNIQNNRKPKKHRMESDS